MTDKSKKILTLRDNLGEGKVISGLAGDHKVGLLVAHFTQ